MPSFEDMFIKSKGKPIVYQDRTLVMSDILPTNGKTSLRLTFDLCNGHGVKESP